MNRLTTLALFATILLTACKTTQPVMLPQTHDSIVIRTEYRVDSVWRDRWHTERIKGDTVYIHDSIFMGEYKNKDKSDTICVRDSIPYPVEVPVIKKEVPPFYKNCTWGFFILILLIILYILWRIFKGYIKAKIGAIGNIV